MKFGMLVNTQAPPDGSTIPRLYQEILREAELAEEVGFDSVFVPEHHMMPDGYLPAPQVLLAAIASRTSRIRLGSSILQLPECTLSTSPKRGQSSTTCLTDARFLVWVWDWSRLSSSCLARK